MLGNKSIKGLPMWIKRELLVYSHAMVHLADKFGRQLPDTEMVIYSDDVPGLPAFRELTRPPGFRWAHTRPCQGACAAKSPSGVDHRHPCCS